MDIAKGGPQAKAAAALTLVVSLMEALEASDKLSPAEIQQILNQAEAKIPDNLALANDAREVFQAIRL
jgi:hypothetical protein